MNQIKKVIVIGAGASGIAAATRLFERGIKNILVLEAENRIGGRVHTVDLPDGNSVRVVLLQNATNVICVDFS